MLYVALSTLNSCLAWKKFKHKPNWTEVILSGLFTETVTKWTSVWATITLKSGNFEAEFLEEIRRWNLCLSSNHTWGLHKAFPPPDTGSPPLSAESPGGSTLWWDPHVTWCWYTTIILSLLPLWHGGKVYFNMGCAALWKCCQWSCRQFVTWEVMSFKFVPPQTIESLQCISMKNFIYRYNEDITELATSNPTLTLV